MNNDPNNDTESIESAALEDTKPTNGNGEHGGSPGASTFGFETILGKLVVDNGLVTTEEGNSIVYKQILILENRRIEYRGIGLFENLALVRWRQSSLRNRKALTALWRLKCCRRNFLKMKIFFSGSTKKVARPQN
jgi:hypothetical protein